MAVNARPIVKLDGEGVFVGPQTTITQVDETKSNLSSAFKTPVKPSAEIEKNSKQLTPSTVQLQAKNPTDFRQMCQDLLVQRLQH